MKQTNVESCIMEIHIYIFAKNGSQIAGGRTCLPSLPSNMKQTRIKNLMMQLVQMQKRITSSILVY